MEVLTRIVRRRANRDFEVRWPTAEEMQASAALLQQNRQHGSILHGVFAVMDGGECHVCPTVIRTYKTHSGKDSPSRTNSGYVAGESDAFGASVGRVGRPCPEGPVQAANSYTSGGCILAL
eukprot:IDg1333t1